MVEVHGLFIPDTEYLIDLEGLIKYLGEKVAIGWTCLYCNGKGRSFNGLTSVQNHMVSKGHCKILYEPEQQEEEFEDFYDFTKYYESKGLSPETGALVLHTNAFGELILPDNSVVGHRSLQAFYKKQKHIPNDTQLVRSLITEYKKMALRKEIHSKLPPKKEIRHKKSLELRMGLNANNILKLRFRSDCPI